MNQYAIAPILGQRYLRAPSAWDDYDQIFFIFSNSRTNTDSPRSASHFVLDISSVDSDVCFDSIDILFNKSFE